MFQSDWLRVVTAWSRSRLWRQRWFPGSPSHCCRGRRCPLSCVIANVKRIAEHQELRCVTRSIADCWPSMFQSDWLRVVTAWSRSRLWRQRWFPGSPSHCCRGRRRPLSCVESTDTIRLRSGAWRLWPRPAGGAADNWAAPRRCRLPTAPFGLSDIVQSRLRFIIPTPDRGVGCCSKRC